ncbi:unnamed protein product, partial [Mesorhabditis spiculigera]
MSRFAAIFKEQRLQQDKMAPMQPEIRTLWIHPRVPTIIIPALIDTEVYRFTPYTKKENIAQKKAAASVFWETILSKKELVPAVDGTLNRDHTCHFCYGKAQSEAIKRGNVDFFRESDGPWRGHKLRDIRGLITCPVLYRMECFACGATGIRAHTVSHCPFIEEYRRNQARRISTNRRCK